MSHYSNNSNSVRVDFFREYGKWHMTEAVIWPNECYNGILIHDAFKRALHEHFERIGRNSSGMVGWWAVCLEPYHEHSHPIMMKI